jgi:hypothetical protein
VAEFALTTSEQHQAVASALPLPAAGSICAAAGPGVVPAAPVQTRITKAPAAGTYDRRVAGTFDVEGGVIPLRGPMPTQDTLAYRNVKATPDFSEIDFDTVQPGLGGSSITTSYRLLPNQELDVVQRVVVMSDGSTQTFAPVPAVKIVALGTGVGDSWSSAGTDPVNGTSMVVQGKITRTEVVDLCGEVVDSYRVESTERIVNLKAAFRSNTSDAETPDGSTGKPNVYNVATALGGLFVRTEEHTITRAGAYTVTIDSTSTFRSPRPHG